MSTIPKPPVTEACVLAYSDLWNKKRENLPRLDFRSDIPSEYYGIFVELDPTRCGWTKMAHKHWSGSLEVVPWFEWDFGSVSVLADLRAWRRDQVYTLTGKEAARHGLCVIEVRDAGKMYWQAWVGRDGRLVGMTLQKTLKAALDYAKTLQAHLEAPVSDNADRV